MRIALFLLTALSLSAQDIKLVWEHKDPGVSFRVYGHTNLIDRTNVRDSVLKIPTGTNKTVSISGLTNKWWFTATAVLDDSESDISNVATFNYLNPPTNLTNSVPAFTATINGTITIKLQ